MKLNISLTKKQAEWLTIAIENHLQDDLVLGNGHDASNFVKYLTAKLSTNDLYGFAIPFLY